MYVPISKNILAFIDRDEKKDTLIPPKDKHFYHGVVKSVGKDCDEKIKKGIRFKVKKENVTFIDMDNYLFFTNENSIYLKTNTKDYECNN